ncbi:MAG: DUF4337 domain-containing protein [Betaproteobacteria bacterium]
MEAHETSELIEHHGSDKSKNKIALTISFLAMVLAIASLGGSNATKEATHENILAANAYAFFQAKSIRQTSLKIAVTDLELQLVRDQAMPASTKEIFQKKIDDYKKTIDRYESEPDTQEGKKELLNRAKDHEKTRDHAMRQDPWFDYAEGMLQIAIVLLSVSILGSLPWLFVAGSILGLLGLLSTLNGFLLLI